MHAVKNGFVALGIGVCLSGMPVTAQPPAQPPSGVAPAIGYRDASPGAASQSPIRQVAGRHPSPTQRSSKGLIGSWFGSSDSGAAPAREPQSLFERLGITGDDSAPPKSATAAAPAGPPDWSGVPYHRPTRTAAATPGAPITDPADPSNRSSNRESTAHTRTSPGPAARVAANPQIPTPPAEGTSRVSRRDLPAQDSAATSTSSRRTVDAVPASTASRGVSSYGALSETESSRRQGRRVVDPLDAYLDADRASAAAATPPVRADGQGPIADRGLADGPRVARRPIPPVNSADSSRRRTANAPGTSIPPSLAAAAGEATSDPAAGLAAAAPSGTTPRSMSPSDTATDSTDSDLRVPTAATEPVATLESDSTSGAALSGSAATAVDSPGASTASDDAWRASTTAPANTAATRPQSPPQLGVQPRASVDAPAEPSQNVTRVNTQPVNVVAEIPGIRVVTSGPAEIPIRQAVEYQIRVENMGTIAAPGTLVRVTLPRWISVEKHQTTRGEILAENNPREQQLLWQVDGLPAGGTEGVTLALSAAEARPFEVAVEWAVLPQSNVAQVRVNEPKLELLIEGPDQVVYGQSQAYKVRVLNPGNGNADEVVFTLSPKSSTPQSQRIGTIPAGKEAHFEVELTARERENLEIHGLAIGSSGLETELLKSIEVIAADLEAVLSGPPLRYQDAAAAYKLEITNHGKAACEQLTASLQLPEGAEYQGGIESAAAKGDSLQWQIPQLAAGASVEYEFQCLMKQPGDQQIAFECQGTAAGTASVAFTTSVEALADLVLSINDPPAPAAVGEEVTYELVIRNRGSKAAADVQALAQFSNGVEPVRVDGGQGELAPGQAMFEAIPRIDPGQEVRLRVIAKADEAGLHRFRTEVRSGEMLLVAEEATRYIELDGQRVSRRSSGDSTVK